MSSGTQAIIMTLLTTLLIPILLDLWKNRGKKTDVSTEKKASAGHALSSRQLFFARLIFSAIVAYPLGSLVGGKNEFGEFDLSYAFAGPDDFTIVHGIATVLFMAATWFILSMYGPLKTVSKES